MSRSARVFVCTALAFALSIATVPARATVIWRGDFQTGNISQWSSTEEVSSNRLQVVQSPVPPGAKYALQATVQPGDMIYGGARAELDYEGDSPQEGDERYYHWQSYFPEDFQPANYWQLFTQWHQYVSGGSPPLAMMVWGNVIQIGNENSQYFWMTPFEMGVWHDFIVHVLWSTDATVGGVEVWYDGQHVLPFTHDATLFPNDTIYVKQGLYRKDVIDYPQTVYHCGMTVATELSDVWGDVLGVDGGVPVPDAGSPEIDAGPPPEIDAGPPPEIDAGPPPEVDAGPPPEVDAGPPHEVDAGPPHEADAGSSSSDGGSHHHHFDAGSPSEDDAGSPERDAGTVERVDAGSPGDTDAGNTPPETDAGAITAETDAGTTPSETETGTTTDAGSSGSTAETGGRGIPFRGGCQSAGGRELVAAFSLFAWVQRRRRTQKAR
jgi:hypothetical protein